MIRFLLVFLIAITLWLTIAPTIYSLDSPELAAGAASLGIVHAPGYPLYLLIGHGFAQLPIGDVAFRLNLFSAVSLLIAGLFIYQGLYEWLESAGIAMSVTLTFIWSYFIWQIGIVTEVYASHLLALSMLGYGVLRLWLAQGIARERLALVVGSLFGLALAMHPVSIFFAPALAATYRLLKISWRNSIYAGLLGLVIFSLFLLYFPIRYANDPAPAINQAGTYRADGTFEAVDLQSIKGIVWMVSGQQFSSFFFKDGLRLDSLYNLWGNFLGFGMILGLAGQVMLWQSARSGFWLWLLYVFPYTLFFMAYGAEDKAQMISPIYLLWLIPLAYGWQVDFPKRLKPVLLVALPLALLVVNYPLVNIRDDDGLMRHTEATLDNLPENAAVFGYWQDIVSLQYMQVVEKQRPDLALYNLYLFDYDPVRVKAFVDQLLASEKPVVFLSDSAMLITDEPDHYVTTILMLSWSNPDRPTRHEIVSLP